MTTSRVEPVHFLGIWKVWTLVKHGLVSTNSENIVNLRRSWMRWWVLTRHSDLVVWNLDWACFVEKLGSCWVHSVLNESSVELFLLSTCTAEILSVLRPHSESVLLYLVLHQFSVEKGRVSSRSQSLYPTLHLGSAIQTIYGHALRLGLSENTEIVYQLTSTFRALISTLHVFSRHSKLHLSVCLLLPGLVLLKNPLLASLATTPLLVLVKLQLLLAMLTHFLENRFWSIV